MQSVKQFKRSNNGYIRMGNNTMVGATVASPWRYPRRCNPASILDFL